MLPHYIFFLYLQSDFYSIAIGETTAAHKSIYKSRTYHCNIRYCWYYSCIFYFIKSNNVK